MKKYCFLLLFLLFSTTSHSQQNFHFTTINQENGLTTNTVYSIYQDSKGFLWIGTIEGLNRYDGIQFTNYKQNVTDSTSLSNSCIYCIAEDKHKNLWIGTENGLNLYHWETDNFTSFLPDSGTSGSISSGWIKNLLIDKNGDFWIGTREGLNKLIPEPGEKFSFKKFYPEREDTLRTDEWSIETIASKDGKLWVGTWGAGLCEFNSQTGKFKKYMHDPLDKFSITGNIVERIEFISEDLLFIGVSSKDPCIFSTTSEKFYTSRSLPSYSGLLKLKPPFYDITKDEEGRIWVGNFKGVSVFDPKQGSIICDGKQKKLKENNYRDKQKDQAKYIFEDRSSIIWIGYGGYGIDKYDPNQDKFADYRVKLNSSNNYQDYLGDVIFKNENNILISCLGDGIIKTGIDGKIKRRYTKFNQDIGIKEHDALAMCEDYAGQIWVGTKHGLIKLDKETGMPVKRFYNKAGEPSVLTNNSINQIIPDGNSLWIITPDGLNLFNAKKEAFEQHPITKEIGHMDITALFKDSENNYWIGTTYGLYHYDSGRNSFSLFTVKKHTPNSICNNQVNIILEDNGGNLWFGTKGGLSRFEPDSRTFENFYERDGLASDVIEGGVEDSEGNVWFLTLKGISKLNPETFEITNYSGKDGLPEKTHRLIKHMNGYFSTLDEKGFTYFDPLSSIEKHEFNPPVYFTNLTISGREIPIKAPPLNGKSLITQEELIVPYSQKVLGFKFVALNYTHSEYNQYAYKLNNFDTAWTYLGNKNEIILMNIPPGNYSLMVRASNNDGTWNEQAQTLGIIVTPPWYRTYWAFIIYSVIIVILILIYRYYMISKERARNNIRLERLSAQKEHEIDQMKIQFFINVSHDFRTPLTLIMNPISKVLESDVSKPVKEHLQLAFSNAKKLKRLIEQLLDIRKIEAGKFKAHIMPARLDLWIADIINPFESLAIEQEVEFIKRIDIPEEQLYFDPDKTEKIITNLLSNAFKFTTPTEKIVFSVESILTSRELKEIKNRSDFTIISNCLSSKSFKYFKITVKDSGIGIEPDSVFKIFERFYQSGNLFSLGSEGTGIGLSIVKEFVEILRGGLLLKTELNKGTTFIILLPLDPRIYDHDEIIHDIDEEKSLLSEAHTYPVVNDIDAPLDIYPITGKSSSEKNSPMVLIVEDNKELLDFIQKILSEKYRIKKASNGVVGLEMAKKHLPDLIISDIMMPGMGGIELCGKIKEDQQLQYIPVILLTAKNSLESIKEGYATGADEYMVKPFSNELLLARVTYLIHYRKKLKESLAKGLDVIPKDVNLLNKDEQFLKKVAGIVEKNISNPDFTLAQFCIDAGMSKSQLYKRLTTLKGESPSEFIRNIRLNQAANVLKEGFDIQISELAYFVGFSDPNYFARTFKQYHGKSPREYLAESKKEANDSSKNPSQ